MHSHTFTALEVIPPSRQDFIDYLINEFNSLPRMEPRFMFNASTAEYFYQNIGPNFDILNSYYVYKIFHSIHDFVDMRVNDEYERMSKLLYDWKSESKMELADDCLALLCKLRHKSIKLDLKTTVNQHICIKQLTKNEIIQQTEWHYYQINHQLTLAAASILCDAM